MLLVAVAQIDEVRVLHRQAVDWPFDPSREIILFFFLVTAYCFLISRSLSTRLWRTLTRRHRQSLAANLPESLCVRLAESLKRSLNVGAGLFLQRAFR